MFNSYILHILYQHSKSIFTFLFQSLRKSTIVITLTSTSFFIFNGWYKVSKKCDSKLIQPTTHISKTCLIINWHVECVEVKHLLIIILVIVYANVSLRFTSKCSCISLTGYFLMLRCVLRIDCAWHVIQAWVRDIHIECSKQFKWNLYFCVRPFWVVIKLF